MKIIKCPCFQGILKTTELHTYTLQLLLSYYVSYIWFSMKLFSALSSAVRVPLEDSDLISHIPLASVRHLCGYRRETAIRIRPCPRKWGRHSNIHARKNLVTNSVIMGWERVRGILVLPFEPPAMTRALWIAGCWNDRIAGQPFFSHRSGHEPFTVLTALVSNACLYTPSSH